MWRFTRALAAAQLQLPDAGRCGGEDRSALARCQRAVARDLRPAPRRAGVGPSRHGVRHVAGKTIVFAEEPTGALEEGPARVGDRDEGGERGPWIVGLTSRADSAVLFALSFGRVGAARARLRGQRRAVRSGVADAAGHLQANRRRGGGRRPLVLVVALARTQALLDTTHTHRGAT